MSLTRHHQRVQFMRMKKEDERIKLAYAETVQREENWIEAINKGKLLCSSGLKFGGSKSRSEACTPITKKSPAARRGQLAIATL